MSRPVSPEGHWEVRHRRVTFMSPTTCPSGPENEMGRTCQSKTQVIVGALEVARRDHVACAAPSSVIVKVS